jgi:hypothetical protein
MKSLFLFLALTSTAFAGPRTVAVDLPEMRSMSAKERAKEPATRLELLLSSWTPRAISFESRARDTGAFTPSMLPRVSVAAVPALASLEAGTISARFGAGILPMEREGKISYASTVQTETQSLYLLPGEVGLQFEPTLLQWQGLAFQLGASARPTLAILSRSALGDSKTQTGMGYELSAGGSYDLGGVSNGYRGTEVTASVSQTLGKMTTADLRGFGVQAGVRVGL